MSHDRPQVRIKLLHSNAQVPVRSTLGAAGYDVFVIEDFISYKTPFESYARAYNSRAFRIPLGFALEIPDGWEAQIRPRSSTAIKRGLHVVLATIDSDYRGEISIQVTAFNNGAFSLKAGDRIAQLVFQRVPPIDFVLSDVLSDTPRGAGGFGSTGR